MGAAFPSRLSRRERQIMDVLYQLGSATAADIQERLPDPPSYSAVRAALSLLEDKGHIRHETAGAKYVYSPVVPREKARSSALKQMLNIFFNGSADEMVQTLLSSKELKVRPEELDRMAEIINQH